MTAGTDIEKLKRWVLEQIPAPWTGSLCDHIQSELQRLDLDRIRIKEIEPHPVWVISARLGSPLHGIERELRLTVKGLLKLRGLPASMSNIDATIDGGRVQIVFCLPEQAAEGQVCGMNSIEWQNVRTPSNCSVPFQPGSDQHHS
jgi:hypothetical protein